MLFIPLEGKISWRNPPIVTLLLIALNCLIFFGFQSGDNRKSMEAYEYYFESGLAAIELPRYADYADLAPDRQPDPENLEEPSEPAFRLMMNMQRDSEFMDALYQDRIIIPGSRDYNTWAAKRTEFDQRLEQTIIYRYGLVPAKARPWSFVTMMFVHGGLWHLLGNMVFLWIMGCVLEMGLGRMTYCSGYILAGIFASLVYFAVHHNSYVPSIGASGAMSGLMGALTVLYGLTRIRVFFSTGFYFDYFRMHAVLLLPFWLGKELLAFFLGASGGVAYMAHVGGLAGGALLGLGAKRVIRPDKKAFFEEPPEDPTPAMIEDAMERISRLDFKGARPVLQEVIAKNPGHGEALGLLFNVEKQQPDSAGFHEAAGKYLSHLLAGPADHEKACAVYREYEDLAKRTELRDDLYARLASAFLETGQIEAGKKILVPLARRNPALSAIPALLLRLVHGLEKQGMSEKAEKYRNILCRRYAQSQEAHIASAKAAGN
ncbi:MAG: rhomboid family intramembrane serine protease [Desulfobacterales bacterium]|nr:rhomboid family intramembrane serine protease [Desulfobacterales bacterium]